MIQKSIKWSLLFLVGGLTSCSMFDDNSRYDNVQNSTTYEQQHAPVKQAKGTKAAVKASSSTASKEPMQKSTPGPKRAAAPQLPVIQ